MAQCGYFMGKSHVGWPNVVISLVGAILVACRNMFGGSLGGPYISFLLPGIILASSYQETCFTPLMTAPEPSSGRRGRIYGDSPSTAGPLDA